MIRVGYRETKLAKRLDSSGTSSTSHLKPPSQLKPSQVSMRSAIGQGRRGGGQGDAYPCVRRIDREQRFLSSAEVDPLKKPGDFGAGPMTCFPPWPVACEIWEPNTGGSEGGGREGGSDRAPPRSSVRHVLPRSGALFPKASHGADIYIWDFTRAHLGNSGAREGRGE